MLQRQIILMSRLSKSQHLQALLLIVRKQIVYVAIGNTLWLVEKFKALAADNLVVIGLIIHFNAVAASKLPMLYATFHTEPGVTESVAQSPLPLFSSHVEMFLGQEVLAKSAWKAVLDPQETIEAVSGLELLVFEKRDAPGMKIIRRNY